MTILARDSFQRVTAAGWGTADTGGAWTNVGGTGQVSTNGAAGLFSATASSARGEYLGSVSSRDQYALFRVKLAALASAGGYQLYPQLRRVDANNYYSPFVWIDSSGNLSAGILNVLGGSTTTLLSAVNTQSNVIDLDPLVGNEWFWVRCEAVGASPTTLRIKVWKDGDIEQGFWFATTTDSAAALQVAAAFGFSIWVPSASPPVLSIDDLTVSDAPVTYAMTLAMSSATVKATRFPPDSNLLYIPVPTVARPAVGVPITDPTFGTKITRVSNVNIDCNDYPKLQPWNADQSILAFFFHEGPPRPYFDGTTYAPLKTMTTGVQPIWSNSDPDKIWNTDAIASPATLRTISYASGVQTIVRTFTGYTNLYIGRYEGRPDHSDRYFPMLATLIAGSVPTAMIYDAQLDSITHTQTQAIDTNWMGFSRSGAYIIIGYGADGTGAQQGLWLFDSTLTPIRQLWTVAGRHGDFVVDEAGREMFVMCNPMCAEYLETGKRVQLLNSHNPAAVRYGHVSGTMFDYPGWVGLSNYDTTATAGQPGMDQVALVKLDGSGTMRVFAHAQHTGYTYNSCPFAAWSRDGKRVTFHSEWQGDKTTEVYGFVAEVY